MNDIEYWDDMLTEQIAEIQQGLDRIPSISDPVEVAAALDEVEDSIKSAQGTKRSFKMETRLVQDVQQRRQLEGRLQNLDQQLRTLKADLVALKADQERGQLFVSAGGNGDVEEGQDATRAGNNMLGEASRLQDKTQDSLANTRNMIAASKEVGVSTLEELQRQREVIENIDREADRMDDNLARAEALIKTFGKRMATDSFIQCMALLNCLLLLGVALYAILRNGSLQTNDSTPPEP
uniref:t-SNARE coiled-coil homology domain-containing protein n=1 Tax=Craspedostauros australis TaxID=1486917 RepID=A0A7R9ZN25_9STRA|mmetsp:Transcript_20124/g.56024  ORF Transcript_20124/g.56024 Transcript_20124/m.56024 type:complete len:237 (+) Transcript_20124:220-930(+)|eukprot:CAMPEP_0198114138 /NCGR_PEP_ID=MMETSP1442-20131203/5600_1 /TAXON_ID= /ORGANISM="Craspedostauros australis, Strain CCMP3328" /LENGTH=236 /DNA_ID=CAMNT_0043771379 /DNA_START=154 /DNA_END=864 /DNA_ORIENTATION=-